MYINPKYVDALLEQPISTVLQTFVVPDILAPIWLLAVKGDSKSWCRLIAKRLMRTARKKGELEIKLLIGGLNIHNQCLE